MKILQKEPANKNYFNENNLWYLTNLWFRHESPFEFKEIIPQKYTDILSFRIKDIGEVNAKQYISERKDFEKQYFDLLNLNQNQKSLTYATIVGLNKMDDPLDFPGFTYYFKLNPIELEHCIFEVVAGKNKKLNLKPQKGINGLKKCIAHWNEYNKEMHPIYDKILKGNIDPRIEVIIPFKVIPSACIPEEEQR